MFRLAQTFVFLQEAILQACGLPDRPAHGAFTSRATELWLVRRLGRHHSGALASDCFQVYARTAPTQVPVFWRTSGLAWLAAP